MKQKFVLFSLFKSIFIILFLTSMELPCQTVGVIRDQKSTSSVELDRRMATTKAVITGTTHKIIAKPVIEVLADGTERVRIHEEIISADADEQLLADILDKQERYNDRFVLEPIPSGAEKNKDSVYVPANPKLIDTVLAKGDLAAIAEALVGLFDDLKILGPVELTLAPDANRLNGFGVSIPTLNQASTCALGERLVAHHALVAEVIRYFSKNEKLSSVVVHISQDNLGHNTVEAISIENHTTYSINSYDASRPYNGAAVAAQPHFSGSFSVQPGICYCPYR